MQYKAGTIAPEPSLEQHNGSIWYFWYNNNWWARWKIEKCSLLHAAMHVIHLSIFRDLALLIHLSLLDEPPEFAPKMLSKLSFIIANAASIILDGEKGRKKAWKTQKTFKKNKTKTDPKSQRSWFALD